MNLRMETAASLLQKVRQLLKVPYFGKIAVDFLDGDAGETEDFYIGRHGFAKEDSRNFSTIMI